MPFPGPVSTFDNATRANGDAWAGAGSTIWQSQFLASTPSAFVVASNDLTVTSNDQGALTVEEFEDSLLLLYFTSTTGGALGVYWRLQNPESGSWDGYWFVADGLNWAIKKRSGGGTSVTTLDSTTVVSSLSSGVGIRVFEDTFEVYRYEDGAWDQTPVLAGTDSDFASGVNCVNLPNSGWAIDRIDEADPSLEAPDGPFTLYVDADHPDASDDYNRLEASDPDTPLLTPDRAGLLAYATPDWGDTILIARAENANPEDERGETSCYAKMDHRLDTRGARPAGYPFGDNTGNEPITVKGATTIPVDPYDASTIVDGTYAAIRGFTSRRLKNWAFEDLQFGYDTGGGNDYLTLNSVERCEDLTFTRCLFTGGANQYSYWSGTIRHEYCAARAPLSPGANDPFDGRAFGTSPDPNDSDGGQNSGVVQWVNSRLGPVRGNDAIQVSVGAYTPAEQWGSVLVDYCVFTDVISGAPQFHTDSVQVLGGPLFEIQRSIFIGCETALIASDFHNGQVRFDANLIIGTGAQITIQGTDNFRMRNVTMLTYGSDTAHALFLVDRLTGIQTLGDVRNNILQSINYRDRQAASWWADGTVFDNNIVVQDPGGANPWGQNLPGIPEFGTSDRVDVLGLPTSYAMEDLADPLTLAFELANSPTNGPGIGQGIVIDDPDFPDTDILGRAWHPTAPDCGCFQSDPGTTVLPTARPPYVLTRSPGINASNVDAATSVLVELYPVPGVAMNATTITTTTAYLSDPTGQHIPAVVTVGATTGTGSQLLTIDLKASLSPLLEGLLYPLVSYTVHLTAGIQDGNGTALEAVTWSFRIAGPGSAAIEPVDGPTQFTAATATDRTLNSCTLTFNAASLLLSTSHIKQLEGLFKRLAVDANGYEGYDSSAVIDVGPMEGTHS